MKACRRTLHRALPALALAAPAWAAEGGGHGGGATDLIYPALNFALLVAAVVYFGNKPIRAFFADRRRAIREELDTAAQLNRRAEERFSQWQRKLADLDAELQQIRTAADERAAAERDRLIADAQTTAERIRRDARSAVDQELRRAKEALREEAAELAIQLAGDLLRREVNDDDRSRLLDEFIERIERDGDAAGNGR